MTFKVTILGSSAALPMAGKHHSAHALNVHEQFYLIDCGEGTQARLLKYGINPMKLRAVFISHLHGDHVYGLMPLISTMSLLGRETPLPVFAPSPFNEIFEAHKKYFALEPTFDVQITETDTTSFGSIYENKVMEVYTIPLRHRIPTSGFLFKEKTPPLNVRKDRIDQYGLTIPQILSLKQGNDITLENGEALKNELLTYRSYISRSYAYCSDTMRSGKVASIVQDVDLLYHEATFATDENKLAKQTGHSTSTDAATTALNANARKLIIGHFSGRYKEAGKLLDEARQIFPETYEAKEGTTFEIKPQRQ